MELMTYWTGSSEALVKEAKKQGYQVEILSEKDNFFVVKSDTKEVFFKSTDFGGNSSLALKICNDKFLSHLFLERYNFPVAKTREISRENFDFGTEDFSDFTFPLVVKPVDDGHGNGVKMNISDKKELKKAIEESFQKYSKILIQTQASGEDHRVLVVWWEVAIAYKRVPPSVVGDGKTTILSLIEKENKNNPLRWEGYTNVLSKIKIDDELKNTIQKQGYTLESILEEDKKIFVRSNGNVGTGGYVQNVTNKVNEEIRKMVVEIAQKLNMKICGVDVMTDDISCPLSQTKGIILELNATPGISGIFETTGVNVAEKIIKTVL